MDCSRVNPGRAKMNNAKRDGRRFGNQFVHNTMKRNVGMNLSSNVRPSSVRNVGQRTDNNVLQHMKKFAAQSIKSSVLPIMRRSVGPRQKRNVLKRQNGLMHHHLQQVTAATAVAVNTRDQLMMTWRFMMKS